MTLSKSDKAMLTEMIDFHHTGILFTAKVKENKDLFKRLVDDGYLIPSYPWLVATRKLKEEMEWK